MKWYGWTIVSLIVFLVILLVAVIALSVVLFVKCSHAHDTDEYDITLLADACTTTEGTYCLCKKGTKQTLCFVMNDPKTVSSIQFPQLNITKQLPAYAELSNNENAPFTFSVLHNTVGVFKHPLLSNTICLRDMDDLNNPLRLCFDMVQHDTFLSGPTVFKKLQL